jgi:hypothetical protein
MATDNREMSDQDELIADLLGQGWTHQRVPDSVGVSSKTVQRRMSDPAFSSVVSKRRRDQFGQLSGLRTKSALAFPAYLPPSPPKRWSKKASTGRKKAR